MAPFTGIRIDDNDELIDLSALENLTRVIGSISIMHNRKLPNLYGLENIDLLSCYYYLRINSNAALKVCSVKSVCECIASPDCQTNIYANKYGCNSEEEVEEECLTGTPLYNQESDLIVFPNPTNAHINITTKNKEAILEVNIYNQLGQKVLHKTHSTNSIDVSTLQQGIYIIEITSDKFRIREKLIVSE